MTVEYGYCQSELPWGAASPAPISRDVVTAICQGIKAVGGSWVRMGQQVGTLDDLDFAINAAANAGLKVLLVVQGNTSMGYTGGAASYGALCTMLALRYGPSGTNQVAAYEMWNESNDVLFNPPQQAPAGYVEYLKAGHTAIHSVHSSAIVMPCGTIPAPTTWFGWCFNPLDWYTQLYAAGAKDYMDVVALHLYADVFPTPQMTQWKYMTDVRDLMVAQGDSLKKVWVTEVGTSNPGPGITTPVMERDWLKAMVDGILSYDWMGIFFVYNFESSSADLTDSTQNYGIVSHVDLIPKQPKYAYAQSIAGITGDPMDIVPPGPVTGLTVTTMGPQSAQAAWVPGSDDVGVSVVKIYNAADDTVIAQTTQIGQTGCPINNLTPGTPYVVYAKEFDAAGNPSVGSSTASFTTDAPTGSQADVAYTFTGSTVPTVFVPLGLAFTVSGGVALPNSPTADGVYLTVAPYMSDMRSPDHSSQISVSSASTNPYLAALSLVRMSPDGTQFAGSLIAGGGVADACQIFTFSGGVLTIQEAGNATPLLPGEWLDTDVEGNVYTAVRVSPENVRTPILPWTDLNGDYPGAANLRAGLGWWHLRVGGVNYSPPGITGWKAADLNAVTTPQLGNPDMWKIAITKPKRLGFVNATGLWQAAL